MHNKRWTEDEDNIIRSMHNRLNYQESIKKLSDLTGRTPRAIENRIQLLGVCEQRKHWEDFELSIIHGYAEFMPIELLTKKINDTRRWRGLKTKRTQKAVISKLGTMGYKISYDGEYFTLRKLAQYLGCSHNFIHNLLKDADFKKILNPRQFNKRDIVIHKHDFARFAKKYPGELVNLKNLDLIWYTDVLTSL